MIQEKKVLEILVQRHQQFTLGSKFDKCSNCQYKCCTAPLSVDISFADILNMALVLNETPAQVFDKYCRIGINRDPDLIRSYKLRPHEVKLSLELKTPCPFHINDMCKIYSKSTSQGIIGRPVVCSIFPEIMNIHKTFPVDQQTFNDFENSIDYFSESFPCTKDNIVSFERGQTLLYLKNLMDQELAATEAIVFGHSSFFIDVSDLQNEAGFDTFFTTEKRLSKKRLDSIDQVSDRIRQWLTSSKQPFLSSLKTMLNQLQHSPAPYISLLGQLVDTPALLPMPCKRADLLPYDISLKN